MMSAIVMSNASSLDPDDAELLGVLSAAKPLDTMITYLVKSEVNQRTKKF